MAYGNDVTVFMEDKAGDLGAPGSSPFWLSPDVDIPAHTGEAVQGSNDVRIRVHAHEEPIVDELIVAEVYVGTPGLVLSPTTGTRRIDPGNLRFRPANVTGTEPVASTAGGTLSFAWTPSSATGDPDGPGHRCLIARAFPVSVTPPTTAFDVPNEQHEVQHNIEILSTSKRMSKGGDDGMGTKRSPRKRDSKSGMWLEDLQTIVPGRKRAKRYVVWAFDPEPANEIAKPLRKGLKAAGGRGFSKEPPKAVSLSADAPYEWVDPEDLAGRERFAGRAGLGKGLLAKDRVLAVARVELGPRRPSHIRLGFDHSNIRAGSAVLLHVIQFTETGRAEGGMTIAALAPS